MSKLFFERPSQYRDGEMDMPVCLICGERIGEHVYRGKSVCSECLKFIRANH